MLRVLWKIIACMAAASSVRADNNVFFDFASAPTPRPAQSAPAAKASSRNSYDGQQVVKFEDHKFWRSANDYSGSNVQQYQNYGPEDADNTPVEIDTFTDSSVDASVDFPAQSDSNVQSEVVSAEVRVAEVTPPIPERRPEPPAPPRPPAPRVTPPPPATPPAAAAPSNPTVNDITGCRYGTVCWRNLNLTQKIRKIVESVDYVNRLHGTRIDPRYMLCTGWKESTFNPGARGASGEKGMFQIMNATGRAAHRLGPKVPGFTNLSAADYMNRMVNSTVAQTELSFLTLRLKVNEGASSRVLNGNGTLADYKDLARRYNGTGPRAVRYSEKINSCLSCLRNAVSNPSAGNFTESNSRNCLNRAK